MAVFSGFVAGFSTSGAAATYTVNVSSAGNYDVTLRYANGSWPNSNGSNLQIYVNTAKITPQTIYKRQYNG